MSSITRPKTVRSTASEMAPQWVVIVLIGTSPVARGASSSRGQEGDMVTTWMTGGPRSIIHVITTGRSARRVSPLINNGRAYIYVRVIHELDVACLSVTCWLPHWSLLASLDRTLSADIARCVCVMCIVRCGRTWMRIINRCGKRAALCTRS